MTEKRQEGLGQPVARGMSRRYFLKVGASGLAGAALLGGTGCGGHGNEAVEFTFSFGPDPSGTLRDLVRRFNEHFDGVYKVYYREMSAEASQYLRELRTEFYSRSGDITLIGGDVTWLAQFAADGHVKGIFKDFPDEEQSKYLDGPLDTNTYGGKIYGVPWFTDGGILYYRRDLFEQAGLDPDSPPTTWKELKQRVQDVWEDQQERQVTRTPYGFVFQGANYEGGVVNALEYIYSHGGRVLAEEDENSRVDIDSPESLAGLEMERSMVTEGIAPPEVADYNEEDSYKTFLDGNAVFLRGWPVAYSRAADPDSSNVVKQKNIGWARLPEGEGGESVSVLGGWNFYINAYSEPKKQDAAYEFVKFATSTEQQKYRATEGGFLPTLKSLYDDEQDQDELPVTKRSAEVLEVRTESRPALPYYSDISLAMAEQFNASLKGVKGEVSPKLALQELQSRLEDIIESGS